jgi:hypothetical protein
MATAEQLEHRLRTGERMIEAEPDPEKRERLETFWINLLRQYEAAIDQERDQADRRQSA